MIDVGSRLRPHDKGFRRILHRLLDFLDDLQYRIPSLYKISPMIEFVHIQNHDERELIGVEIGTFRGINAHAILSFLSIKKLYLIDPYLQYEEYVEAWIPDHSQTDFNEDYAIAKRKLRKFRDKINFVKLKSDEAIEISHLIPDGLDFVYIDGNHAYEYVKKDIELYYPKMRQGGILGGDNFETEFEGVPQAVLEFVDQTGLKLYGSNKDWWVVKGEKR